MYFQVLLRREDTKLLNLASVIPDPIERGPGNELRARFVVRRSQLQRFELFAPKVCEKPFKDVVSKDERWLY
jgi:hypothetical protein